MAADIRRADPLTSMIRYLTATTAQELVISTLGQRMGIDRGNRTTPRRVAGDGVPGPSGTDREPQPHHQGHPATEALPH